MNPSSEAAEQMIRISLEGFEVAARLSGSGAKNIAALLLAAAKDQQKVRGKTTLTNMLKSGRPLKVFSIKEDDLKKFSDEAKRYGVLFSAIVEKKSSDKIVDIMVREDDASKINRIVERFNLSTVDLASIKGEIAKVKEEKSKGMQHKNKEEIINDEKQSEAKESSNPQLKEEKTKNQSNPSYNNKNKSETYLTDRKSVKQEIKEIKQELSKKTESINNKVNEHKHIKNKRRNKER